jgi:hypothetical protein
MQPLVRIILFFSAGSINLVLNLHELNIFKIYLSNIQSKNVIYFYYIALLHFCSVVYVISILYDLAKQHASGFENFENAQKKNTLK